MKQTYKIDGMTCNNCKASVEKYVNDLTDISHVTIDLAKGEAEVTMERHLTADVLQNALPENIPCQKRTVVTLAPHLSHLRRLQRKQNFSN